MINVLSVDNMRASDATTIASGISGTELMMRAGRGIYESVKSKRGWNGRIAIVLGSGNNAGDGYVLSLLLLEEGIQSDLIRLSQKLSEDGKFYYDQCVEKEICVSEYDAATDFSKYDIILDCIFGTGFHGNPEGSVREAIEKINSAGEGGSYIVSVDINSGLNGRNGLGMVCVRSDLTVSVGDFQPGHFLNSAKDVMKEKVNCPIGIEPVEKPFYLLQAEDVKSCFKERDNLSNKGTYGYIALIGGSDKYTGAIRLAYLANASMRSGAGVTTVATPRSISSVVASHVLESTLFPLSDNNGEVVFNEEEVRTLIRNRKAIAFGMGIGRSAESRKILEFLLSEYEGILIVDADGISDIADMGSDRLKDAKCRVVLTPHLKEFSRISGLSVDEVMSSPIESAVSYAKSYGVTVLLKGPTTVVTDGDTVYLVDRGCPGMATAGSGDVLSGIVAAVCAANADDLLLAVAGAAYINGVAGEMAEAEYGSISMMAGDTVKYIPKAILEL